MFKRRPGFLVVHLPFTMVILYLLTSIALFWFGPIEWPVNNPLELAAFQVAVIFSVVVGYLSSSPTTGSMRKGISLRPFFYIGLVSVILLQIPVTLTYTGKYPWDVVSAILDTRQSYEEMLSVVAEGQGTRFFVPLLRAIVSPLYFAGLAYGILYFRRLTLLQRVLFVMAMLCPVNLSLLRSTDKEIADLLILLSGFLLVSYYRRTFAGGFAVRSSNRQGRRMVLIAVSSAFLFFTGFAYKKLERLGGDIDFCIADGMVCADYSSFILTNLPDFAAFGCAMLTAYLTNGYYGLSLALQQTFDSTLGLGHSTALLGLYERASESGDLFALSYIAKISAIGWDHRYYWSTIFTWLANDVGFIGALLGVGVMARWFRQSWIDAVRFGNDLAAIVFVFILLAFIYAPANNQIAQTLDLYFSFIIVLIAWKTTRLGKKYIFTRQALRAESLCQRKSS